MSGTGSLQGNCRALEPELQHWGARFIPNGKHFDLTTPSDGRSLNLSNIFKPPILFPLKNSLQNVWCFCGAVLSGSVDQWIKLQPPTCFMAKDQYPVQSGLHLFPYCLASMPQGRLCWEKREWKKICFFPVGGLNLPPLNIQCESL